MKVCRRVLYEGHVQGVGFRFTAKNLAQGFDVAGFVRNLIDGRVELVVEGEPEEVDRLLRSLMQEMAGYIAGHTIEESAPQNFAEFEIRR